VRSLGRWLLAGLVLLLGRGRRPRALPPPDPVLPAPPPSSPRGELLVVALLLLAAVAAVAFVVVYAGSADTQLLGLTLGAALACVAAAFVVTGKRLVPQQEEDEPYPQLAHQPEQEEIARMVEESGSRLTRRRLLAVSAGVAGTALAAAVVTPLASLGPVLDTGRLKRSPWRRGRRLVDADGAPLRAADVLERSLFSAFPEGADRDGLASPIVVVRLDPDDLELPDGRERWAPEGIVAYSKICTHAACAVSLYRTPLNEPTAPQPALVCPCHFSTFDPAGGGTVLFGPAGRDLPQLPLEIDDEGFLVAGGDFSGPVGPSWWGVRRT
jgi:ubiquinol-cytochrome c reductase iron-sulfur subunit